MLLPNALKILDTLSIYPRIRNKGYSFETLDYRDRDGKLMEVYEFGGEEKYGYKGLRIYRTALIEELLEILRGKGVRLVFGKIFKRVVKESEMV